MLPKPVLTVHLFYDLPIWPAPSENPGLCSPHSDLQNKAKVDNLIKKGVLTLIKKGSGVGKDSKYCYFPLLWLSHED